MTVTLTADSAVRGTAAIHDAGTTTSGAQIVLLTDPLALDTAVQAACTWPLVGLDVETAFLRPVQYDASGKARKDRLDFYQLALRSVQFGNDQVVYVVDCALVDPRPLRPLLEGPAPKVAHNATFEYKVLRQHGFAVNHLACTMLAERLLMQGLLVKSPSLAEVVKQYLGREMLKDVRDTFVEERQVQPLRPEQVRYAADDVDVLLPIFRAQTAALKDAGLWDVARFEWRIQQAFGRIELRGLTLDEPAWRALMAEAQAAKEAALDSLTRRFAPAAVRHWQRLLDENETKHTALEVALLAAQEQGDPAAVARLEEELAATPSWLRKRPLKDGSRPPLKTRVWDPDKLLTSPKQLTGAFADLGLAVPDTNRKTLQRARWDLLDRQEAGQAIPVDALAAIDDLLAFRKIEKRCTSYSDNWLQAISPVTGRIHAEYDTLKETGRTGCREPNVQNVPKRGAGKVYRRCFVPRAGYSFVDADFSNVELRVAAELSGDRAMIQAFLDGHDLHAATAARMFNLPLEAVTPDQRIAAKAVNFGIIFGIGPRALAEGIANDTGVRCSFEEGRSYLQRYGKAYPRLTRYLKEVEEAARRDLVVHTALGHRRRFRRPVAPVARDFTDAEAFAEAVDTYQGALASLGREAQSVSIQGSAACIAKLAILDLEAILPAYHSQIVAFIHDEVLVEAPDPLADTVAQVVKATMEAAGTKILQRVPCVADAEVCATWYGAE